MRNPTGHEASSRRAPQRSGVTRLFPVSRRDEELAVESSNARVLDARTIKAHAESAFAALKTAAEALDTLRNAQLELFANSQAATEAGNGRTSQQKPWLSVNEAAAILNRSPRWIYRNAHRFPFVHRVSRKTLLVSWGELNDWLSARKP